MEAQHYLQKNSLDIECKLCPHSCLIKPGTSGVCKVRYNDSGVLEARNYGLVSSMAFDPVEKKPLYHFYPGSEILSVGSLGCNLKCTFCQNWEISQTGCDDFKRGLQKYAPKDIVNIALSRSNNLGIAYTYNEPIVFYEFMMDIAQLAKTNNLKNVMVTNAYVNTNPLKDIIPYIDAFNVDLKSFINSFYEKITRSSLKPVLKTLETIVDANKHLEITYLIIPMLNDTLTDFEQMVKWIKSRLGDDIVLHLSRYFPRYKAKIEPTSIEKMLEFKKVAEKHLQFVYLGNIESDKGTNTYCPECKHLLIERNYYKINHREMSEIGDCMNCGAHVINHI